MFRGRPCVFIAAENFFTSSLADGSWLLVVPGPWLAHGSCLMVGDVAHASWLLVVYAPWLLIDRREDVSRALLQWRSRFTRPSRPLLNYYGSISLIPEWVLCTGSI